MARKEDEILYVGFNQDQQCFACGTETGFRIYNCDPFKETFRRDFQDGGIGLVEMLFRCNILALVGGGKTPKYPPNKVMIWDDHQSKCIGELSFRNDVKAVKLRRDRVVVVLEYKLYVYNFTDLKLLHQIDTISNPTGLAALSPNPNQTVLACPGLHKGHVRLELYDHKKTNFVAAHEAQLSCMALSLDGGKLATASEQGTIIRLWNSSTGEMLQELRRGANKAEIYCINFNYDAKFLVCSSDKGTAHVFALTEGEVAYKASERPGNSKSSLSFMGNILPKYFSSEWSFAQFKTPEVLTYCAFGAAEKDSIIVTSVDGTFQKCKFDPARGGECKRESFHRFIKADEETAEKRNSVG
jgi:WD40 repeat protein